MDRLPSPDEILAWLRDNPGQTGKREIARAFGLKGAAKTELKQLLARMAREGLLEKRRRQVRPQGELAPVLVLRVVGADADGDLWAEPAEWEGEGERPRVLVRTRRDDPALGAGDRLLGRMLPPDDGRAAGCAGDPAHRHGPAPGHRHLPRGRNGRADRRHRQAHRPRLAGPARRPRRRARGRAGRGRAGRPAARPRAAAGARCRPARRSLGAEVGLADRHPRARHPRRVPRRGARRGRGRRPGDARPPRGPARAAFRDHRPVRRARPRRRGPCASRRRPGEPGRSRRLGGDRRRRALRPPRHRARPRGPPPRQLDLLPRPCRADAAGPAVG